jgi:hypothetical protein
MNRVLGYLLAGMIATMTATGDFGHGWAAEPTVANPKPDTQAKFRQDCIAYQLRMAEAYDAHTNDPPAVRAAAHDLIVSSRKFWLDAAPKDVTRESLLAEAARVIQQGSNDPLILLVAGAITPKSAKEKPTLDYLRRAREAMQKSTYGAWERADAAMRDYAVRHDIENRAHNRKRKYPDLNPVMQAIAQWFAAEGSAKDDQRVMLSTLANFQKEHIGEARDDKFADLISQTPGVDPWIANMLQAKMFAHQGWTVWNKDWDNVQNQESNKLLRQGADYYIEAWKHNPNFPEPATELIAIARRGLTDEKPRYWFDQAVKAQFDYQPAYNSYRTAIRPDYHGSIEQLYAFGLECAKTGRFDTIVPFELMESLCVIDMEMDGADDFWRRKDVYEQVEQLLNASLAAPVYAGEPQSDSTRAWIHATHIAVAIRAHRYGDTTKLWEQTDSEHLQRAFSVYQVRLSPSMAKVKTAAMAAGIAIDLEEEVAKISDAASAERLKDRFEKEVAKPPAGASKEWIEYWRAALSQYVDYYAGKWVDVTFVEHLPALVGADDWKVIDAHTVESHSSEQLRLEWLGFLKGPYECSVDIEVKKFPSDAKPAGILLGNERKRMNRSYGRLFGIDPLNETSGQMTVGEFAPTTGGEDRLRDVNQLLVRAWPRYSEMFVNGERTNCRHDFPSEIYIEDIYRFDPCGGFMLWTPADKNSKVDVVYSNLKIRRLSCDPPRPEWSAQEGIEYNAERIQEEPNDPYHYFDRGAAYFANGDYTNALADYQRAASLRKDWNLAQVRIGMCQAALGNYEVAVSEYQKVLDRNDEYHPALNRLAWLQATCPDPKFRNGQEAVKNAERAYKLKDSIDSYRIAIIAALAEAGRLDDAKKQAKAASHAFRQKDRAALAPISAAIEQGQPYHEEIRNAEPASPSR